MTTTDHTALEVQDLSVSFGGVHAVREVSLEVRPREVMGLIGPNGAGKTTLLNLISGHTRPDRGAVRVGDREVGRWPIHRRARLGVARSYQSTTVFPGLTVADNVWLAAVTLRVSHYQIISPRRDKAKLRDACDEALATTNLTRVREVRASALGHGEARALEVAMLVASGASIMLLDEPAAGMAAGDVTKMIETIASVHERTDATLVIVEHKLPVIFGLCDRIAVLDQGALLAVGEPDEISRDARVRRAYLGEDTTGG